MVLHNRPADNHKNLLQHQRDHNIKEKFHGSVHGNKKTRPAEDVELHDKRPRKQKRLVQCPLHIPQTDCFPEHAPQHSNNSLPRKKKN